MRRRRGVLTASNYPPSRCLMRAEYPHFAFHSARNQIKIRNSAPIFVWRVPRFDGYLVLSIFVNVGLEQDDLPDARRGGELIADPSVITNALPAFARDPKRFERSVDQ